MSINSHLLVVIPLNRHGIGVVLRHTGGSAEAPQLEDRAFFFSFSTAALRTNTHWHSETPAEK